MSGIAITLASGGNTSGGNLADSVTSTDGQFTDAAAAASAVANGFLVVNTPVTRDGSTLKKTAYSVSQIKQIVSL